jgi:hypothetical protein
VTNIPVLLFQFYGDGRSLLRGPRFDESKVILTLIEGDTVYQCEVEVYSVPVLLGTEMVTYR